MHSASPLISLHIRSMWETICDAVASSSGINLCSKIPVYPILPPPPRKPLFPQWKIVRFEGLWIWLAQNTLPLWKWKVVQFEAPLSKWGSGSSYVETNFCIPRGYHLVLHLRFWVLKGFSSWVIWQRVIGANGNSVKGIVIKNRLC